MWMELIKSEPFSRQTYQLIRNLVAPGKPTEQSFADLVKLIKGHYQPTPLVIVQQFKCNSRTQLQGESIATFIAELRRLSEHCGYGDSLNDMLRDRLVCGTTNSQLQKRLLSEPDLIFKKALNLAQALESSEARVTVFAAAAKTCPKLSLQTRSLLSPTSVCSCHSREILLPMWRTPLVRKMPFQRIQLSLVQENWSYSQNVPELTNFLTEADS